LLISGRKNALGAVQTNPMAKSCNLMPTGVTMKLQTIAGKKEIAAAGLCSNLCDHRACNQDSRPRQVLIDVSIAQKPNDRRDNFGAMHDLLDAQLDRVVQLPVFCGIPGFPEAPAYAAARAKSGKGRKTETSARKTEALAGKGFTGHAQ